MTYRCRFDFGRSSRSQWIRCEWSGPQLAISQAQHLTDTHLIADADHDAQQAAVIMLLAAQRAENGTGIVLVDLGDAVFDVIRCRYAVHFQLGFGAVHFLAKCAEDDIAGSGIGGAGGS